MIHENGRSGTSRRASASALGSQRHVEEERVVKVWGEARALRPLSQRGTKVAQTRIRKRHGKSPPRAARRGTKSAAPGERREAATPALEDARRSAHAEQVQQRRSRNILLLRRRGGARAPRPRHIRRCHGTRTSAACHCYRATALV